MSKKVIKQLESDWIPNTWISEDQKEQLESIRSQCKETNTNSPEYKLGYTHGQDDIKHKLISFLKSL